MARELAQLLVDDGMVAPADVERALARQREAGGSLDTALLELGLISEERLTPLLAAAAGLPLAPPEAYQQADARARRVFPAKVAERHGLAPIALEGRELSLVAAHPIDAGLLDEISFMLSLQLTARVGVEWRVRSLIQRLYGSPLSPRLAKLADAAAEPPRPPKPAPTPAPEPAPAAAEPPAAVRPSPLQAFGRDGGEHTEPLAAALAHAAEAFDLDWDDEAAKAPALTPPPAPSPVVAAPTARNEVAAEAAPTPPPEDAAPAIDLGDRSAPPHWTLEEARQAMAAAASRDEVLLVALRYARDFFDFAATFAVAKDAVVGHDALGAEDGLRDVCRTVAFYASEPGVFANALQSRAPYLGPVGHDAPGNVALLDGLGREAPRTSLVYPVVVRDRPVCILYADNGEAPVSGRRLGDLFLLLSVAGAALERIIRARKAKPAAARPKAQAVFFAPVAFEDQPADTGTWAASEPALRPAPPPQSPPVASEAPSGELWRDSHQADAVTELPVDAAVPLLAVEEPLRLGLDQEVALGLEDEAGLPDIPIAEEPPAAVEATGSFAAEAEPGAAPSRLFEAALPELGPEAAVPVEAASFAEVPWPSESIEFVEAAPEPEPEPEPLPEPVAEVAEERPLELQSLELEELPAAEISLWPEPQPPAEQPPAEQPPAEPAGLEPVDALELVVPEPVAVEPAAPQPLEAATLFDAVAGLAGQQPEVAAEVTEVEPVAVEPVAVEPVAVEPVAVEPAAVEPVAVEPAAVEPVAVEPVAVEPAAVEPVAVEPVAVEPAAVEPAAVEPVAVEPVALEPVAAEPLAPHPSADRPVWELPVAERAAADVLAVAQPAWPSPIESIPEADQAFLGEPVEPPPPAAPVLESLVPASVHAPAEPTPPAAPPAEEPEAAPEPSTSVALDLTADRPLFEPSISISVEVPLRPAPLEAAAAEPPPAEPPAEPEIPPIEAGPSSFEAPPPAASPEPSDLWGAALPSVGLERTVRPDLTGSQDEPLPVETPEAEPSPAPAEPVTEQAAAAAAAEADRTVTAAAAAAAAVLGGATAGFATPAAAEPVAEPAHPVAEPPMLHPADHVPELTLEKPLARAGEGPRGAAGLVEDYLASPRGSEERMTLLALLAQRADEVAPILCDRLPGPLDVAPEALGRTPVPEQGPVLAAVAALSSAAVKPLTRMLADPAPERRRAAAALLGMTGDPAVLAPLAERCLDPDARVAEAARLALLSHRLEAALKGPLEKLRRALLSGLADKSAAAARAIGALRDAESIPLLIQALEGSDGLTAGATAEALAAITMQRLGPAPRAWLLWWKQNRGRPRRDWLFGALTSDDREIRLRAAAELREAAPSPVNYSADLPEAERQEAAQAWAAWFERNGYRA